MTRTRIIYAPVMMVVIGALATGCFHAQTDAHGDKERDKHYSASATATSDLKFLKRRIDFGTVNDDTTLTARFHFTNTGTANLVIEDVFPDCSCTSFSVSKKTIAPKDSACIILNMDTKNKNGKLKIYSTVSANTPTHLYSIEIVADVKQSN